MSIESTDLLYWSLRNAIIELSIAADTLKHGDWPNLSHVTTARAHLARSEHLIKSGKFTKQFVPQYGKDFRAKEE